MFELSYHYRRRHISGKTGISISDAPAIARRDDTHAWVFDYLLPHSTYTDPVHGRRGSQPSTIARPEPAATRLWLWPARPLRLVQQFDTQGQPTLYRIDFATFPQRQQQRIYQTDLYLDLFISGDLSNYAILDEDELEFARTNGLINDEMHQHVLAQADTLVEQLEAGRFDTWLADSCAQPFELEPLTQKPSWTYKRFAPGEPDDWPAGIN